jgi:hypothetical protein
LGKAIKAADKETIRETKQQKNEEWLYVECAAYLRDKITPGRRCLK